MQNLNAQTRPAVVAGSFYSNDKATLQKELHSFFENAKAFAEQNVQAVIVPHAGYVYSAQTAAIAYKTLHKKYKNVFLIGSSHHVNFNGASIYSVGNYQTPLGVVKVNQSIVNELLKNDSLFTYYKEAHTKEHTLEVQLPFLQTIFGEDLRIVPIIVATSELETIMKISKALEPYFNEENLFVISTDLSHYPSYEDAKRIDKNTLDGILSNNTLKFVESLADNEHQHIDQLYTSACGWSSVLVLMNLTQNKNFTYELLEYVNSGDKHFGDKKRVVGYGSFRVFSEEQNSFLSTQEKEQLLDIAKQALYEATLHNKKISIDESKVLPKLKEKLGAFVTLYKNKNLRGCIGRFEPNQALYSVVIDMAIAAAQQDTRFTKVTPDELEILDLEISVLTPRKRIYSLNEITLGKHGIYIQQGNKHGTYLPHVATQMQWSVEEFVQSCAIEKANIHPNDLDKAEFFTYEAIVFDKKHNQ